MTPQQIIDAWNAQADEANQWGALGEDEKLIWAYKQAIASERTKTIAQIITMLELQHEAAKHQHNHWLVAANLIRAEFWDEKKAAHGIKEKNT